MNQTEASCSALNGSWDDEGAQSRRRPGRLLYGQMREDPRADVTALSLNPSDRVLTVTSGGCTALTLLAQGPRQVVSVDFNPAQNHLLELKLAAIRRLPLDACRRFLGVGEADDRWERYRGLADALTPDAREYWDHRRRQVERGALYAGTTEALCQRWMSRLLFGLIHPVRRYHELLSLDDLGQQRGFYRERWNTWRWRAALRLAFHPLMFRLVYGAAFRERFGAGDITANWIAKIERAFTEFSARDNYFLTQLLCGRYPPGDSGLPPYLRQPGFERIRAYADRLSWRTQGLVDHLAASPGRYSKITLSNAFEWIRQPEIHGAFTTLARAMVPGGRAVLRHLLAVTPLPAGNGLVEDVALSDDLTLSERAFLYERVSVYQLG